MKQYKKHIWKLLKTYSLTGLTSGGTYFMKVSALNSKGSSSFSQAVFSEIYSYGEDYEFKVPEEFDDGTMFMDGIYFAEDQDFTSGTMDFGANQHFATGTEFAIGQEFDGIQNFGKNVKFANNTNFNAAMAWDEEADFSAGTHTFNAVQAFAKKAHFAAGQVFDVDHDFSAEEIKYCSVTSTQNIEYIFPNPNKLRFEIDFSNHSFKDIFFNLRNPKISNLVMALFIK